MLFDNNISLSGNLVGDPELRFTQGGMAVAKFAIAQNDKSKDGTETVHFFDITCFRRLAENVAESLSKGDKVSVQGTLRQNRWETEDGQKRSRHELVANDVAASLQWAVAAPVRNESASTGNGQSADEMAAAAGVVDGEPF